ncbi:UPF0182 family membrane protein [Nocardioides marmoribigeumensis]|uniref:UPF0182 protein J2S63_002669 n=1 Tax=Nocardioides marmoribigeumensis TaxID=433649 RepID=A0ABU2BXI6_9ACTN|nr:UPF0182 family protein [Nocardioides marmoribigeumensis]MDR7363116.1 uncharacterized membrane protein (UPF0182 family) [Nocardioides marmoribigeumensis]
MSGLFPDDAYDGPAQPPPPARPQRRRALLYTALVMVALFFAFSAFTSIWTDRLWFSSVDYPQVFRTVIATRVILFIVFGALFGGFVAANIAIAFRVRPVFRPRASELSLNQYRDVVEPMGRLLVIGLGILLGLMAGGSAAGEWRQFLMWRNGTDFGTKDPYFKRDIGFFVFSLPWFHYVVNLLLMMTVLGLVAAIVTHYLFGGIRLQNPAGEKVTEAAQVQFSVLLGIFVLVKAVDYWLDRFDLTTDQGRRFTGINYTAFHAVLPAKNILMFISVICALLFFANIARRTWLLPAMSLGMLVLSAVLLGAVWPGIVWQFQVRPSEPDKEEPFLSHNIQATRAAYDVDGLKEQDYDATVNVTGKQLRASAESLPGIRLIDPQRMSAAFDELQQVRGYYSVASVLDVDRYNIDGKDRDIVLGVRELDQTRLAESQRNWANEHTVYTHGYGVIAAYGNNRQADDSPNTTGQPPWAERDLPPQGDLTNLSKPDGYEGRIYFGEKSPAYSIVGKAKDNGKDVELDIPEEVAGTRGNTTYDGADGVPIGGLFNKLLYAAKYGDANILLSSRVNENSKILYVRNPRDRVEKVAPWLTVDGDPYPAVVDDRVQWILDGYTMTDRYPNSERDSFESMISDALTPQTSYVTLPTDQINYMRNSVKVTVDAYDGTVRIYQWQSDPILETWKKIFPGLVLPEKEISPDLMQHLRYPEDMFKVQRSILAKYHVTRAQDFYKGTDLWTVPQDPAQQSSKQPPYRLSVQLPPEGERALPGADTSETKAPVDETPPAPVFSLTSVYAPNNRDNLASFISVNSDATSPDYGEMRVLRLPDDTAVQGPAQVANTFASDNRIQDVLAPIKINSSIVYGNLLTLPVGGGLLYVQPVYAVNPTGQGTYPVLRFVLASFGQDAGYGTTLKGALDDVLDKAGGGSLPDDSGTGTDGGAGDNGDNGDNGGKGNGQVSPQVLDLLRQADAKYDAAERALKKGDTVGWARSTRQAEDLVRQALAAAQSG